MKERNILTKAIYAAVLVGGMVATSGGVSDVMAAGRGNSGLPPGPGNPLASLQTQVNTLNKEITQVNGDVTQLQNQVTQLEQFAPKPNLLWINHLDLVPGDATVVAANSSTPPVVGGPSGLVVTAPAVVTGKNLEMGLQVPPGYKVKGIAICYQDSNAASFISQVQLSQLTTASTVTNLLTDSTPQTSTSATCVDTAKLATAVAGTLPLRLNVGVTIVNAADAIVIRAVGLYLEP
jgi:hypothetical protein